MARTTKAVVITAADGHRFSAALREPTDTPPVGGLVLIQEIFGLTTQLRKQADRFADLGYRVIVPAIYDRIAPGQVLEFEQVDEARRLASQLLMEEVQLDIAAAAEAARCGYGVAVVGYCWGGGVTYLAACELDIDCAISFYGTRLLTYLGEKPRCPMQFHFGRQDQHISMADVEKVRTANPTQDLYVYEHAGHAFANEARPDYHPPSKELAEQRMFRFIRNCLTGGGD